MEPESIERASDVSTLDFGGRPVGPGHPCYVVAEIGPNWCVSADPVRNIAELDALIEMAAAAGADCVKLQLKSVKPGGYYDVRGESFDAPIADVESPWRTRGEFIRMREPTYEVLQFVAERCAKVGLQWTASPWDVASVELLAEFSPPWVKVASATVTDRETMQAVARMRCPIVMSTGMSDADGVLAAIDALGHRDDVLVAHCTSSYPTPDSDVNLAAIEWLRTLGPVGYSGHEDGIALTCAAVVMGACWVERHVTMSRSHWHKDHRASLEPDGLRRLVRDIRRFERARGDGIKRVMPSEQPFMSLRSAR